MNKTMNALLCCLALAVAPLAVAQTTPAKPPVTPAKPVAVLDKPELKADTRTEDCKRTASNKNLTGEAREIFMTSCMK